jgi:hypothetical protein
MELNIDVIVPTKLDKTRWLKLGMPFQHFGD